MKFWRGRGSARGTWDSARTRTGAAREGSYSFVLRLWLLFGVLVAVAGALMGRAVDLQLVDHGFLAQQGDERFSRVAAIPAHRGSVTDRNGEPLAVSTPVDSVWVSPRELGADLEPLVALASTLGEDRQELLRRVSSNGERDFLYVVRGLEPADARRVKALNLPGVYLAREFRRYYPAGE